MKIIRSTTCSLKFSNPGKRRILKTVLTEYGRVVNLFIDQFWGDCPHPMGLKKEIVNSVETWLSFRLRQVAAREAIGMVKSFRNQDLKKATKPRHSGKSMSVSATIADLTFSKTKFDRWLTVFCIGNRVRLDLPIKLHKHFNKLSSRGRRLNSYVIKENSVQFCFEIKTGPKKEKNRCIGIDTGIKALASLSTGEQLGRDIEACINRSKRCKPGSKGKQRAIRALRQRMNEVAKEVCSKASLVVVENLKGITRKTKRRLGKQMRRSIGSWNVRYWLQRLQFTCEDTNVSFRTVSPWKTSQTCPSCGHIDRKNRNGEIFRCLKCDHSGNADVEASKNILSRFLSGPYGAGCKPCPISL